jgi:putative transposase
VTDNPLTNILRNGAYRFLAQAVDTEAEVFLAAMKGQHGHGPECTIQTGNAPAEGSSVKIGDRGWVIDGDRIRFCLAILPK